MSKLMPQPNLGFGFAVAAFVGVIYDWMLTFGQEVELIWHAVSVTTLSLTDRECFIIYNVWNCIGIVAFTMLWVITITQLHAMYQRSRKIQVFLIVTFLAFTIFNGRNSFSPAPIGAFSSLRKILYFISPHWILKIVWEVFAICLAVCIAVKHFHELQRHSEGGMIGDCFTVLMKTHLLYFASFIAVSCFKLNVNFNPNDLFGLLQYLMVIQMSVLGPCLILGVREHHAKLVADSDAATGMTSIAFEERVHILTSSSM
ncbi:hypothetical protein BDR07DRAFT_1372006 [Suillus spraguei]|nr:hypothetical protein BDR07DRAFT_1372006 [Suillus spraguei]